MGFTGKGYRCVCRDGFEGKDCTGITTFINFHFIAVVLYIFFLVLFTSRLKFLVHFNLLNVCLMCNKVVVVVVVVVVVACKCRSYYQEVFLLIRSLAFIESIMPA